MKDCFDCKFMKCCGYKCYMCTLHDEQVSSGHKCDDFEEE